ncbi:MAG: sugar ABC transporter substrate-binding protein [Oscillospiraceae bacterium]|jgi:multiple sugar transport system substrate-binding protein|nr:sugar ABC transporter substrate-binding protein [Oscillospiraceae bacterium]
MKKWLAMLLCAVLVCSLFSVAQATEKKVLRVATWDATTTAYLDATKAAFEASHPDITIEYVDLPAGTEYIVKLTAMLTAGDTVDVFDVKEVANMPALLEMGAMENLDAYIQASGFATDKYAGMDKCYTDAAGSYYALPFRNDFWLLYYNKDLFDKAGVAYPTNDMTWDQYADLARKMTSGTEGVDKVYGTHYHTWRSAVANWAVCDGVNTLIDGEYSDLKYFYDLAQKLEDEGVCRTYNDLKASGLNYRGGFEAGDIAMLPMGTWLISTLIADRDKGEVKFNEFGLATIPHAEGVPVGSTFGSPTGAAINVNSAQKDLAWEFISWRSGAEGAKAHASVGTIPAYVSEDVAEVVAAVKGFPGDAGSKAALLPTAVYLEVPVDPHASEIRTIVDEETNNIMSRAVTVDEGIANMNERAAEVLGE